MLEPTPANRALVNRGIAEAVWPNGSYVFSSAVGDRIVYTESGDRIEAPDYTRDLNACYDVCEERGWYLRSVVGWDSPPRYNIWLCDGGNRRVGAFTGTDLRWLVALAVWEAVKAAKGECDVPKM